MKKKTRQCGWCGEVGDDLIFVAEVGGWFHEGTCLAFAHEEYNEGKEWPQRPGAWRRVSTLAPAKVDMPCVVALGPGTYDIATSRKDSDWWLKNAYYDGDEAPTYWMPLPELPKD